MNDLSNDDAIDALLREQFDGAVPVDGFCDQVMGRLPVRRRRYDWPLVAGNVAGAAMCWWSLKSAPIARVGWQDWLAGEPSEPAITLMIAIISFAMLALAWITAQADDPHDQSWRRLKRGD